MEDRDIDDMLISFDSSRSELFKDLVKTQTDPISTRIELLNFDVGKIFEVLCEIAKRLPERVTRND